MKTYPSIEHSEQAPREQCTAFVKYDGSNIRAEWSKKQGWHKFGSRKLLFNETSHVFGCVIPLFQERYGEDLVKVFTDYKDFRNIDRFTVFFEWFGAKSFAGWHDPEDPHDLILFDVNPHKKGFIEPSAFLKAFGHLRVAEPVYIGELTDEFIEKVRTGEQDCTSKYEIRNEIPEGVVCKGGKGHKLWMAKIKTNRYLGELKTRHPADWETLWE